MKKFKNLLAGTVACVALSGTIAHAERASDGDLKILFWQAVSTMNPYLSGGTKEVLASSMVIEPLARYNEKGNSFLGWRPRSRRSKMAALQPTC